MRNRVINSVFFASLLALVVPSLAVAASPGQADKIRIAVSWSDLDIESEAGAKILYARVERASERACGVATLTELGSIKRVSDAKECFDYLVEKAVKQIDNDELSKVHAI